MQKNYTINNDYIPKYDDFLQKKKLFNIEKKLNQEKAYFYQGIQLNKKELHNEAITLLDYKMPIPEDLDVYISRSSITNKPQTYKHPEWLNS